MATATDLTLQDPSNPAPPPAPADETMSSIGAKAPGEMSVEKNLQSIYGSDNGILAQARTAGLRTAAQRGLLNSSIAVGASEDAAIRSALPIAQQDADTATRFGLQKLGFLQQKDISAQESDQALKAQTQSETARSGLSAQEAAQGLKLQTQAEQHQLSQAELEAGLSLHAQAQAEAARSGLSAQDYLQQLALGNAQFLNQSQLSQQEAQQALNAQTQAEQSRTALSTQEFSQASALAQFNSDSAQKLAQMDAANRVLIQTSDAAAENYRAMNQQIAVILADPNMNQQTKVNAVNVLIDYYQGYFDLQSSLLAAGGFDNTGVQLPAVEVEDKNIGTSTTSDGGTTSGDTTTTAAIPTSTTGTTSGGTISSGPVVSEPIP